MSGRAFDHREPGTAEAVWAAAFDARPLPSLDLDVDRVVAVAAHPDDESLGAAGLLATAAARGIPVEVLVVTDGEGSHPDSPTTTPRELAARRRDELSAALGHLGLTAPPLFLGIPDGRTDEHRDAIAAAVRDLVRAGAGDSQLLVSPWRGDGHRDHRVVGEEVEAAAAELDARVRSFPIWLWHWGDDADVPWDRLERLDLDGAARAAKSRALDAHRSQTEPLSDAVGDEALLHERMRSHFARPFEVLVAPAAEPAAPAPDVAQAAAAEQAAAEPDAAAPDAAETVENPPGTVGRDYFDGMYARHDDPWGFDSRWYEERKRAVLMASLPRPTYDAAFEAGCSTGALTVELAERCARVLAVDLAPAAVERARRRLAGRADVEVRAAALPDDWPDGTFDLIVLSEVAYYWDTTHLDQALAAAVGSLRPGGHLVACHWRHPVAEYPRSGDEVHAALALRPGLVRLVRHEEEDFVLEVFGTTGARSVASESGLVT